MSKYLQRVFGRNRTPVPPNPYKDDHNPVAVFRKRYGGLIDPERPHYTDPRFESRGRIPWFSIFGINRDWSMSVFKFTLFLMGSFFVHEYRLLKSQDGTSRLRGNLVTTKPAFTVEDEIEYAKQTREELDNEGYAFVGVKHLDFVGSAQDLLKEKEKGSL
eukprot:PhF_6_TR41101/c0_g1_i1/m.62252